MAGSWQVYAQWFRYATQYNEMGEMSDYREVVLLQCEVVTPCSGTLVLTESADAERLVGTVSGLGEAPLVCPTPSSALLAIEYSSVNEDEDRGVRVSLREEDVKDSMHILEPRMEHDRVHGIETHQIPSDTGFTPEKGRTVYISSLAPRSLPSLKWKDDVEPDDVELSDDGSQYLDALTENDESADPLQIREGDLELMVEWGEREVSDDPGAPVVAYLMRRAEC